MKTELDLAPGVHRIEHAYTNCYVIADDEGVTLVDAGFPSTGQAVIDCLTAIGRQTSDIKALLLTHGHFDHVGFARGLHRSLGVPVWVHPDDRRLAAHPYRYRPQQNRFAFPVRHPRSWPILGAMTAAGALAVRGVEADRTYADGEILPVPGRPRAVHTPVRLWCTLVITFLAPAATSDTRKAYAALDRIGALEAGLVLPGHGDPWLEGTESAVAAARDNSAP